MGLSNRSAELFTCKASHLNLLTDDPFQDASQQMNTFRY